MPPVPGTFEEPRGLGPDGPLRGLLRPPGSKSLAQRVLLCAAMARGRTEIHGLPQGDDVQACLGVVQAFGARLEQGETCVVQGLAGKMQPGAKDVEPGESGTLARLSLALLALHAAPGRHRLGASGSLRTRHSRPLLAALRAAGAGLDAPHSWPVEIQPAKHFERLELSNPISSQELSALWLAAACASETCEVLVRGPVPSQPYLALTEQVLGQFGISLEHDRSQPNLWRTSIAGPLVSPGSLHIEADASSAAVALAAGCLSAGQIQIAGLPADSLQGDVAMLAYLRRFGCEARSEGNLLLASGAPTRGADIDLVGQPDLAPVLAIVAAAAAESSGQASELRGLGTLRGKESDRLAVLAKGLTAAGWKVEEGADSLHIGAPQRATPAGLVLDPAGDHRMAFAFALLGLLRPGLLVANPSCVSKSWPGFWDEMSALGGD